MSPLSLAADPYTPQLAPVGGSLVISALIALLPLLTVFVTLGWLRWKAHWAGLTAVAVAILVAVLFYRMPAGLAVLSATEGAVFGLFPIMWIVFTAIVLYQITVVSGRFEDLRATFHLISDDPRIQAIIIAFCFGGLLEALAGFGAPVAITGVMLMALGFSPAARRRRRAARQHRPGRLRCDRHPDHHGRFADQDPLHRDRRLRRAPDPVHRRLRAAAARPHGRWQAWCPPDLAGRGRRRRGLRHRPVDQRHLHLGRAHRHHRLARRARCCGRLP